MRRRREQSSADAVDGPINRPRVVAEKEFGVSNRLTRLGWHFSFIACFAIIGGSIRGLNLMLILAGLIFGAMIMSWRIAKRSIDMVDVRRRLPAEAVAGKPFQIRYLWTNSARFSPIWSLRVNDAFWPTETVSDASIRPTTDRLSRLTSGLLGLSRRTKLRCGVGVVPAGTAASTVAAVQIDRRGVFEFSRLAVSTKFPLSLIESRRRSNQTDRLHVYPATMKLRGDWRRRLRVQSGGHTQTARQGGQEEGEFYGIRDWQHGDSPRWIHWRTTARLNEPAVRQYQRFRRPDLCLILDAYDVQQSSPDAKDSLCLVNDFENSVSLTATLMQSIAAEAGDAATLGIASDTAMWISETRGRIGKRNMMRPLTQVHASADPALVDLVDMFIHSPRRPKELLIVSTRSREQALLSDPLLVRSLGPWFRRSQLSWVCVKHDLDSFVDSSPSRPATNSKMSVGLDRAVDLVETLDA